MSVTFLWELIVKISAKGRSCRTTAKEKKPSYSSVSTRPFETATLIFRAAVSLRLHKPMTTCRDTVADGRLFCRVLFSFSQYPWSAPAKKSVAPPSEQSGFEYELYHVSNLLYKTLLRPAGSLRLAGRFLLFSEDKPTSKKIFEKFSKRRLLAGSERLRVRLVSGKGETHLIPPGRALKNIPFLFWL